MTRPLALTAGKPEKFSTIIDFDLDIAPRFNNRFEKWVRMILVGP